MDGADARENFAHMNRLAKHVVDAGGEHLQRFVERLAVVEAKHRRGGALADEPGKDLAVGAIADQEGFDRSHVDVADFSDPFLEFCRDRCPRW